MKKELTTPSSLCEESEIAKKWWIAENDYNQMQKLAAKYYMQKPNGRHFPRKPDGLSDEEILFIYQQETSTPQTVSNSVEATKGEWVQSESGYTVLDQDGNTMASCFYGTYDESCKRAELICTAVNNYQRLLDSNAELLEALERSIPTLKQVKSSNVITPGTKESIISTLESIILAIQKAKELK